MRTIGFAVVIVLCGSLAANAGEPEGAPRLALLQDESEEVDLYDEFTFLEDAGMVESTSRHRQEIGMSPSAVTVLTREDVEASGANNIPDLLRLVPGMDVAVLSASQTSVSSRMHWTSANNHYQVLIDGRDAVPELLGQMPWMVETVSLDDVERIEIVRGPASSLYGSSALAGVISITTRVVPEKTSASAYLDLAELGYSELGVRGSTRIKGWGFSLSGNIGAGNSLSKPQENQKEWWKLRSVVEYRWSESERFKIDFSASQGHGQMNTGAGMTRIDFGIRALRLAYESQALRGRLYWYNTPISFNLQAALDFAGIKLATFLPADVNGHTVDGEVQWTLPELHKSLLLILGGGGRVSYVGSGQLLDGATYSDITSPDYRQPGIDHWEGRAGAFIHAEYKPGEWVTVNGSIRFDYNTVTDPFISPRLVAVVKPKKGQYIRAGVSRAFLKPAFINTHIHPMVAFPEDSPITGPAQDNFQEFMSKSIGNPNLKNAELLSFEGGYLGQYLDGQLSVALDFYYNQLRNIFGLGAEVVPDAQGLPDLNNSVIAQRNFRDFNIHGFELVIRYYPVESVSLMLSWASRQVLDMETAHISENSPKNLVTLGGRFRTDSGLLGSLYIFSRSEFTQAGVENPQGLLAPKLTQHQDNSFLILGKLGYQWQTGKGLDIEMGAKLFLPFSPFSGPLFRYYEEAGGVTTDGKYYGGEMLTRMVTAYLQGSF
jgi:outer membrane receptor for ferrienterochelin and colicin